MPISPEPTAGPSAVAGSADATGRTSRPTRYGEPLPTFLPDFPSGLSFRTAWSKRQDLGPFQERACQERSVPAGTEFFDAQPPFRILFPGGRASRPELKTTGIKD